MSFLNYNNLSLLDKDFSGNKTLNFSIIIDKTNGMVPGISPNIFTVNGVINLKTGFSDILSTGFSNNPTFGYEIKNTNPIIENIGFADLCVQKQTPSLIYKNNLQYSDTGIENEFQDFIPECVNITNRKKSHCFEFDGNNQNITSFAWGGNIITGDAKMFMMIRRLSIYAEDTSNGIPVEDLVDLETVDDALAFDFGDDFGGGSVNILLNRVKFFIQKEDFNITKNLPTSFGGTMDITISGIWTP